MIYQAAVARWGETADCRLVGNYAAISAMPDGSLRLARSPWNAPPLYYANNCERAVASPLLRALFAAGVPRDLDYDYVIDQLAYDFRDGDDACWYRGVSKVPQGSVTILKRGSTQTDCWYRVDDICRSDPRGAAERALELVRDASEHALNIADSPALALSGGLDSSITASCLIEALPASQQLKTISFGQDSEWPGASSPDTMGDEIPLVREFAKMHPRISMHVADRAIGDFDHRTREMAAAMQIFAPGLANVGKFHGIYAKASQLGCDTLFSAELANQSFSADGRWAYAEYARAGKWGELLRLLANRPGDDRPILRKIAALSILPHLPAAARRGLRALVHPQRRDMVRLLTPLSVEALGNQRSRATLRASQSDWEDLTFPLNRQQAARHDYLAADSVGEDVNLAFEQLYGVRRRDVTAYRPLIEFCIGLPTESFACDGAERKLAKQMAKGRMPEEQRLNPRYGQHNADWHTRIGRRRGTLLTGIAAMRDHEFLSRTLDLDRIETLLRDWPEQPSLDIDADWPRMLAIPRAVLAAQFIGLIEGRNDL
ncbi:hypothetical protein GRI43_10415 [Altererythrobacter luteolus]|uniref:Asparagine synthetase domain-containing protein n=1 Tax=Pontixanthobacter luteolus TaxID=295089 RepID=A0A6I4V265_9SPHN|nr:asparagine synthase-related protein [Pontixanthobacter luteolus]MXP47795.1 hypothetical protein [Pontixanthobacter luteolus]